MDFYAHLSWSMPNRKSANFRRNLAELRNNFPFIFSRSGDGKTGHLWAAAQHLPELSRILRDNNLDPLEDWDVASWPEWVVAKLRQETDALSAF